MANLSIFKKIFGNSNDRLLKTAQPFIGKINSLSAEMKEISDDGLSHKTKEFRQRIENGEDLSPSDRCKKQIESKVNELELTNNRMMQIASEMKTIINSKRLIFMRVPDRMKTAVAAKKKWPPNPNLI